MKITIQKLLRARASIV